MAEAVDSGDDLGDSIHAGRGELLTVLLRHEVRFAVIGGAAIQSLGRRHVTEDIDLTPDTEGANLQRLADALNELECLRADNTKRPMRVSTNLTAATSGEVCPAFVIPRVSNRGTCVHLADPPPSEMPGSGLSGRLWLRLTGATANDVAPDV